MAYILFTFIVATLAAFGITLLRKWGIIEYVQVHGNNFFSEMFRCDFCLSWWAGVLLSILIFFVTWDVVILFIPFCSTMITRKLL